LDSTPVRASDFVATFLHELQYMMGALDEIENALNIGCDYATRAYFEERRSEWLRHVATLTAGFRAFCAEWLEADAEELLKRHLSSENRWLAAAEGIEPDAALITTITGDLANEYRRLAARLN
jgi:hypothetical protein